MNNKTVYSDEYVKIYILSDNLYLESIKNGMPFNQLNDIINSHPEFKITDFNVIKAAINSAPQPPKKFGELKEKIVIRVSEDGLKAKITYNTPKDYLDFKNRENLIQETYEALNKNEINFGIKRDFFQSDIEASKTYTIAEGQASIDGKDSIVKMYELSELKPEIKDDGKTNYYELKLINKVKAGDWLGERIEAKEGFDGRTVTGNTIKAVKGKQLPLLYDKNTVYEILVNDKTILFSKINGAVNYIDGKISVSCHLEIDGDVDFNTGNINFDGYVTVNGTITDGFSVEATKDIEIKSPIGLGNVKEVKSHQGSIFIRGGIVSKNQSSIYSKKDIYTKFADNTTLQCGGLVHIGFYCINSNINAKEVFIESVKGNIIGGHIKAETKVTSAVIGSPLEVKTVVEVTGFNRSSYSERLDAIIKNIEGLKDEQQLLKKEISSTSQNEMNSNEIKLYNQILLKLVDMRDTIKELEHERKNINRYLRVKGDGEISITKKVYPNCTLIIKNTPMEITSPSIATSFFYKDNEVKQT